MNATTFVQVGLLDGNQWAAHVATLEQLMNLAAFHREVGDSGIASLLSWPSSEYKPRLAGVIGGVEDYDRSGNFWAKAASNDVMATSQDYARTWLAAVFNVIKTRNLA